MTVIDAIRASLAKLPPAIWGAGAGKATFRAACCLVRYGLNDTDALVLLHEYNQRSQPPWSKKELKRKLKAARRTVNGSLRANLPPPAIRVVWKVQRKLPATP